MLNLEQTLSEKYPKFFGKSMPVVRPRLPYVLDAAAVEECAALMPGVDAVEDFKSLRAYLQEFGLSVPTLYKQYTEIAEPDGVQFLGFNVDPDFSNGIDGLICVELERLRPAKRKRYIDAPPVTRKASSSGHRPR